MEAITWVNSTSTNCSKMWITKWKKAVLQTSTIWSYENNKYKL